MYIGKVWGIMEDSKNRKHISGFYIFLCVVFFAWTGILLWSGLKQFHFSDRLQKEVVELFVEKGGSKADLVNYLQADSSASVFAKKSLSQTNTLSYLIENEGDIPDETESQVVGLVSLFSGKNTNEIFWSTAASQKARELQLFRKSDKKIAQLEETEKTAAKQEQAEEEEEAEKKTETEEEEEAEASQSEEMAVPAQSIVLFQNGSPDITSMNNEKIGQEKGDDTVVVDGKKELAENLNMIRKLKKSYSRSYMLQKFFITDSSTSIDNAVFQPKQLLNMDLTVKKKKEPQILILHTNGASEAFIDSRKGKKEDSIIGVGTELARILSEEYGYQVLHDKTEYDKINGKIDRNKAYNNAYSGLQKTLKKYPSIDIIIDLHRDGVGNDVKRTTVINGKRTAQAMFFNGLSRNASGDIAYLQNDNLQGNLAFSLQLKIAAMERFADFARPVYLKGYRYNMHLRKRYTLIELGNENNTVQEQKNAAAPLAMVIDAVLQGK